MDEIDALKERAKELRCLYAVDAVVSDRSQPPTEVFSRVLREIPVGWQNSSEVRGCIEYLGRRYPGPDLDTGGRILSEPLHLWGVAVGRISVSDGSEAAMRAQHPFLVEEVELLRSIAVRLGEYLERKHTELIDERSAGTRNHWAWRERFARALAERMDARRFGVAGVFLGGSTARGDAGPGSDIDLYVVFEGTSAQRRDLVSWLEGWSLCLGEIALQQTGQHFSSGILNVQWLESAPDAHRRPELQELRLGTPSSASRGR